MHIYLLHEISSDVMRKFCEESSFDKFTTSSRTTFSVYQLQKRTVNPNIKQKCGENLWCREGRSEPIES